MAAAVSMTSVPAMAAGQTDSAVSTAESATESATENTGSEAETESKTESPDAKSDTEAPDTSGAAAESEPALPAAEESVSGISSAASGSDASSAEESGTSADSAASDPVDTENTYRLYLHEDAQGGFAEGEYVVMTAPDGSVLTSTKAGDPDAKSIRWVYADGLKPDTEYTCQHFTASGRLKDILTVNGIRTTTYTVKVSNDQVEDSKQAYVKANSFLMREGDVHADSIHVTFQSETAHGWGSGIGFGTTAYGTAAGVIPGSNLFRAFEDTYTSDGTASSYGYDYSRQNQYGYVQGRYGAVKADKFVSSFSVPKGETFGLLPLDGITTTKDGEEQFLGWYDARTGEKITDDSVGYDGAVYVARFGETGMASRQVFRDITPSSELYDAAYWAAGNGIADTANKKFNPDKGATRAEIIMFLYRQFGKPDTANTAKTPFKDVKNKAYYAKAVAWAYQNGYTTGTSKNRFSPNRKCTRGEFLTFLQRICPAHYGFSDLYGETINASQIPFTDVTENTPYAQMVEYLVDRQILFGLPGDALNAKQTVSRGEVLYALYRMDRQEMLR